MIPYVPGRPDSYTQHRPRHAWIKITGGTNPYSWTQVRETDTAFPDDDTTGFGMSGTTAFLPAREIAGRADVPVGEKVLAYLAYSQDYWVFRYDGSPLPAADCEDCLDSQCVEYDDAGAIVAISRVDADGNQHPVGICADGSVPPGNIDPSPCPGCTDTAPDALGWQAVGGDWDAIEGVAGFPLYGTADYDSASGTECVYAAAGVYTGSAFTWQVNISLNSAGAILVGIATGGFSRVLYVTANGTYDPADCCTEQVYDVPYVSDTGGYTGLPTHIRVTITCSGLPGGDPTELGSNPPPAQFPNNATPDTLYISTPGGDGALTFNGSGWSGTIGADPIVVSTFGGAVRIRVSGTYALITAAAYSPDGGGAITADYPGGGTITIAF